MSIENIILASAVAVLVVAWYIRGVVRKRSIRSAIAGGALVIDVRSPQEYAGGHYPDALNVPHDRISDSLKKIGSSDRSIIVYCASGARSAAAAATLRSKGYAKVINAGGYASMPV